MKLTSKDCRGLYARGAPDDCPSNYALDCKNLMASKFDLIPRPGFTTIANSKSNVTHISIFEPIPISGVVSPKIILQTGGGSSLFNITDAPGVPFYTGSSNYHTWANFFGRGYFTLHNTIVGNPTEFVQVYEGSGVGLSRPALGLKPVSAMAGATGGGGHLGVGIYLMDVVYVTTTGFITKPSGSVLSFNTFGSFVVNLNTVPIGPTGTAARRIIMTKAIPFGTYTGNPLDYEFFFPGSGLINNNVGTTVTINEFDGNLVNSADYLFDELESLLSGVGIGEYNSRMLVWGENANPSVIRISKPGDPESISATSGFLIIDPSESGGVTNCVVLRNDLYIFKGTRIFITTDNGDNPSTWPLTIFDAGVGTEAFGITRIYDSKGNHLSQFLIAARSGLLLFDGLVRFPELTFYVQDIWEDIDKSLFSQLQVALDPINKGIYITIPRNGGTRDLLYGDYSEGMTYDKIKWFIWQGVDGGSIGAINCIVIRYDANNNYVDVIIGQPTQTVEFFPSAPVGQDSSAFGDLRSFDCTLQSPVITIDPTQDINQTTMAKVRAVSARDNDITVQAVSAANPAISTPIYIMPFTSTGNYQDKFVYIPFVDNQPTVKFTIKSTHRPRISRIVIDADVYGQVGPQ